MCVVEMCGSFSHSTLNCLTLNKREPPLGPVSRLLLLLNFTFSFGLYVELGFSRAVGWTKGKMAPTDIGV